MKKLLQKLPSAGAGPLRIRKILEWGCACGLLLTIVLTAAAVRYQTVCARVCGDTLRLHILANSDTVEDQLLKLQVRDAVLACLDAACPAGNQTDARSWAARNLFTLQLAARHALARCGVNAPVQVQLVNMYFPARQYTGGCLPAGRYDAVRITIGSGSGQNWWCVLYPGLCRAACGGYALPEENDLVCGDYILRLRFVDWWNRHTASRTTRVLAG